MKCNCKHNNKENDRFEKAYLDINGVSFIFNVMKDKLSLSKTELLDEIQKNTQRIENLESRLEYNYYTKHEVDNLLPTHLTRGEVVNCFHESTKNK